LRGFTIFLSAVAIFQRKEWSFQIFLTFCFNFLTSCSVLSDTFGGLFLLANYNAQHSTAQHSTAQHSTAQHNTTQHNTTQHNTTQHNTTQHNTTQHNTTQHNTTQHNIMEILTTTQYLSREMTNSSDVILRIRSKEFNKSGNGTSSGLLKILEIGIILLKIVSQYKLR
jgi:hypothetical protein